MDLPCWTIRICSGVRIQLQLRTARANASASSNALVLEGLVNYGTSFEEGSTVVHWCVPGGTVTTDTGATGPAQICKDTPLGTPTKSTAFTLQALLGYLREEEGSWRLAAGVSAQIPIEGTRKISAVVPITIAFASDELKYKGLIRITPGMTWSWKPGSGADVGLVLMVAVLGQRSLFSESFDAL